MSVVKALVIDHPSPVLESMEAQDGASMTRCCSKCGVERPMSQFHADKRRKSGKKAECKFCSAADLKRRMTDPKMLETNRARALKHFYLKKGASPRLAALLVEKRRRER